MRAPPNQITGYQPLQAFCRAAGRSHPYDPSNFDCYEQDDQLYALTEGASHSWEPSGCESVPEGSVVPGGALPETVGHPKSIQPTSPVIFAYGTDDDDQLPDQTKSIPNSPFLCQICGSEVDLMSSTVLECGHAVHS